MKLIAPIILIIFSISLSDLAKAQKFKLAISKSKIENKTFWVLPEGIIDPKYSLEGDSFSAILSKDSARKIKVPFGSKIMGEISEIQRAKYLGRDDQFEIHVKSLLLPDGSLIETDAKFQAKAKWEDYEDGSISKSIITGITKESAKLIASSAVGASDALIYGGIGTAISSHGISIAIGASIGAGFGIYNSIVQPGDRLINSGFYLMGLKAKSDLVFFDPLPIFSERIENFTAKDFGIDIKVRKISTAKSKSFGDYLLLSLELENNSTKNLNLTDLVISSSEQIEPIFPNPLMSNLKSYAIKPESKKNFLLAYNLGDFKKEREYKLEIYDPIRNRSIADCNINLSKFI